MKRKQALCALTALCLTASLLGGCSGAGTGTPVDQGTPTPAPATGPAPVETPAQPSSGEPKYGGEIVAYIGGDPMNLDPAVLTNYNATLIISNLAEGLLRLAPAGADIEPGIAESWECSEDGLTWTFHLRGDAKFHNGRTVEAADFKYTFERIVNPATMSAKAWMFSDVAGADAFSAGTADEITGIQAPDPQTLTITLNQPMAPFLSMMASPNLAVVPKEVVEQYGEDFGKHVCLAGPFQLQEWTTNGDVVLTASEDYWAGRPYLDSVRYRVINDENTRIVEFDAGQLDVVWIPSQHWDRYRSDPVMKDYIGRADTVHTDYFVINMDKAPLNSSPELRQAIFYGLDMQAIVDYNMGRCAVADGILPPNMLGSKPTTESLFNLEKAKELLAQAGYPDGVPGTFELLIPAWPNFIKICEIYQQNLKNLGINVELRPLEDNAYNDALVSGDFEIAWGNRVAEYADSDAYFYPLYHSSNAGVGGNVARYSNPEVDKLIEQARLSTDSAEREALYNQLNALVDADMPYVYLTHNQYFDITQPYVRGYQPSPLDLQNFMHVWLDK